jgi:hypothetical protein
MTSELHVRADARSILANILNYFSDEYACIQELLQNARRAEASEVLVEIDRRAGTVTVTDNGHGVIDPQDLLNLGKSEWAESIATEQPAGMGLFSVFKLGDTAVVRSGDWRLTMDYTAMCKGKPATLETGLQSMRGTQVEMRNLHNEFCTSSMPCRGGFADAWQQQALYMPYTTTIIAGDERFKVERYDPQHLPKGAIRHKMDWGFIDIHTEAPDLSPAYHCIFIQQGVAVRQDYTLGSTSAPWIRIHAKPGTVNFRLPDRDKILQDARFEEVMAEIKQACVDAVLKHVHDWPTNGRARLAEMVYHLDRMRAIELPEDLQRIRMRFEEHFLLPMQRHVVADRLAAGELPCAHQLSHNAIASLIPKDLLYVHQGDVELFKAMFPGVPVIEKIACGITPDQRSPLLWRAGPVKLEFNDGEIRILQPAPECAVLVDSELEEECEPPLTDREKVNREPDFVVVHTCEDAVTWPDLDPWFDQYEEHMSRDEIDDAWRTSSYAMAIAATWPGPPAMDVTPEELFLLLRERYRRSEDSTFRLSNANFELGWGNCLTIHSLDLEEVIDDEVTHKTSLVAQDGYLREA